MGPRHLKEAQRMNTKCVVLSLCAIVLVVGAGCGKKAAEVEAPVAEAPAPAPAPMMAAKAMTTLEGAADSGITGTVHFEEADSGVTIVVEIAGAPAGPHGFHIHETGDCSSADFKSAGGHFNPGGVPHGGPADGERHAGDLGNIEIGEDGTGRLEVSSEQLSVAAGEFSVVGRAVVLHADADDLVSQPTGAAGARLACGVIG